MRTLREQALLVEMIEATNLWDADLLPDALRKRLSIQLFTVGGAVCSLSRHLDFPLTNRVIGLGLREPASRAMVGELVARYKEAGNPFLIQLSPAAEPTDLPHWLEELGMSRGSNWLKMYRRAQEPLQPVRTDLRIERATPDQIEQIASVTGPAFGTAAGPVSEFFLALTEVELRSPDWRWYIGYDGDTPVSVASLRIAGEVAGLYSGATLESHRGRGGQSALFERRIREAVAAGCRWLVTETGEEQPGQVNHSYRNMLRFGFQLAYARPNYGWRPSPPARTNNGPR